MTRLRVICAGAFGREVASYALAQGTPDWEAALEDLHETDSLQVVTGDLFVIASGDPSIRHRLLTRITAAGGRLASVVHPMSCVDPTATIGEGVVICPFVFVGPGAVVGDNVVLNVHASCGHDVTIGAHSVLSPYAFAAGNARLGERVLLGSHAFVSPGTSVGRDSKVSAGAGVTRDVGEGTLTVGPGVTTRTMFRVSD